MPINKKLAKELIKTYGYDKGKEIYYKMEQEGKEPFKKGLKTAKKKGETGKRFPYKKKGKG